MSTKNAPSSSKKVEVVSGATKEKRIPQSKAAPLRSLRVKTKVQKEKLVINRHRQIVDAAILVFEQKGFHGATLRDVGRAAGVPQGTIYNYVESKEDILYLVCDRIVTDFQARVRAAYEATDDAKLRLNSILRATCRAMMEHEIEIRILYREHHHLSTEARDEIIARINEFVTEVEHAIATVAGGKTYNVRFACNMVTFLPSMFALRSWVTPKNMPVGQQVDEMVHFLSKGLELT